MRRGRLGGEEEGGGAWECSAMMRAAKSRPRDSLDAETNPRTTGVDEML
jgi:hypothetical protein